MSDRRGTCYVYWLHREDEPDPSTEGYVGYSTNMKHRSSRHRRVFNARLPFVIDILYEGTLEDCKAYERRLRPEHHIGWNRAVGGGGGTPHDEQTKQHLKIKASARANTDDGRERMRKAALAQNGMVWKGREHRDSSKEIISAKTKALRQTAEGREQMRQNARGAGRGAEHWRYGKTLSDETKSKLAAAKLGTKQSEDTRQKRAASMALRKQDPAYQEKMRQRGIKRLGHKSPEHAAFMRQRWQDRQYAEDMSAVNAGRKPSEEAKQKRRETMLRRYADPDFLAKMRASWKRD